MPDLIVTYTEEQMKAMEYILLNPQDWIQRAWNNKARQCMEKVVLEVSDKNPTKIDDTERDRIVRDADIKPRKEREEKKEK